jgi:hypothetical protein
VVELTLPRAFRRKPGKSWPKTAAAMLAVATITSPSLAIAEDCSIVSLGKRIVAREGGKFLDVDADCTQASFSMPQTLGFAITELEGQVELTFDFAAPPRVGSLALTKVIRSAVLATGRTPSNVDWLTRQCLNKAAPHWGTDNDFEFAIPETLTRLDQQRFSCGPQQTGKPAFQINFHFQDASYFARGK